MNVAEFHSTLGSSSEEQELLRPVARWAVFFVDEVASIFEHQHDDPHVREAIRATELFAAGKKRDNALRMAGFGAMRAGKDVDEPSKHIAKAAMLAAAVAYTHTDLQEGIQGVRQARHILGSVVHAAYAAELVSGNPQRADDFLREATQLAPAEVGIILAHMPPQPKKATRIDELFFALDSMLRAK